MSDVVTTAPEAARVRNVLGQKPRTESEERKAWGRRFNRWYKNHARAGVSAEDLTALYKGKASKAVRESKAGVLFLAMQAKAVRCLPEGEAAAMYAAGPKATA